MATNSTEVIERIGNEYKRLLPLLNYLRVRLKYDTVRWIRTYGTKDDIVFSTRVKTFERTLDKLVRKAVPLTKHSDLLGIALSGEGTLDDLIGLRFICFDAFQIYRLVSYFLITERVSTSERTFYISSKADLTNPIYRFLQSNGFDSVQKEGREYEDINFIIRFSHPIDRYFGSGREEFESLAQRADSPPWNEKLAAVNKLFDALKTEPDLISAISQFPIECQIVTATQHIYNRTQRPHYEYILQAKGDEPGISAKEIIDLAERLDLLKLNLLAADLNVFSIHKKFGIRYEAPSKINPGNLFELAGRLPKKDILGENARIENINTVLLTELIANETTTLKRRKVLDQFFKDIAVINRRIAHRAKAEGDISTGDVLHITDLEAIAHPNLVFWSFQRIIILIVCVMLLYVHDELVLADIVEGLRFGPQSHKLADLDIVIGRLFENLEHIDNAIHTKLWHGADKIAGWRDGYFSKNVFSDPLIQWRYASFMYSKREYDNALQETRVGMAVYAQLEDWAQKGIPIDFPVPERILFTRRSVEYELCSEVAKLKFSPAALAGVMELCNCVLSRADEWNAKLEEVALQSRETGERARCICFQILFRLCSLSAGGLKGPVLGALHDEFRKRFDNIDRAIVRKGESDVKNRTWWLLAKAVMQDEKAQPLLKRFHERIDNVVHHPLERKRFEKACATLITLWRPERLEGPKVTDRNDFVVNALNLLKTQTEKIASSDAISRAAVEQSLVLTNLFTEVLRELKQKGKIEANEPIKKKIAGLAGDAVEHIFIDTAVAGLRSVLGI